jgi:hypothetical protein
MAIVPIDLFTAYIRDETGQDGAAHILAAYNAAEGFVQKICQRTFSTATGTPTARVFGPKQIRESGTVVRVHDFMTTTGLVVSNYGTTVAASGYQLEPLNGLDSAGELTPYTSIRILNSMWTTSQMIATITITADWGWTANTVPALVAESVKLLGKDYIQHRDAKFGYIETSMGAVSAGRNYAVLNSLSSWRRTESITLG